MLIKPYTKFIIECQSDKGTSSYFKIMRYNTAIKDWEILEGIYLTIEDVQKVIDEYNQETGLVELDI